MSEPYTSNETINALNPRRRYWALHLLHFVRDAGGKLVVDESAYCEFRGNCNGELDTAADDLRDAGLVRICAGPGDGSYVLVDEAFVEMRRFHAGRSK